MIPPTARRVQINTKEEINQRIRDETGKNLVCYAGGDRESIDRRIEELEREWDMERVMEANAAGFSLAGLALGTLVDRKWYILPALVGGFLLQHAIQGWCPPVPVLRRLGLRTQTEIETEKHALKALRGDYDKVPGKGADDITVARDALKSAERL